MQILNNLNHRIIRNALTRVNLPTLTKFMSVYLYQEAQIRRQNKEGVVKPTAMHLELTTFCPQRCKDCYLPITDRLEPEIMESETARKAMEAGRRAGMRVYTFIGGEPISAKTLPLVQMIVKDYPWATFYTCTNGSYLARHGESMGGLLRAHNLSIGLSVDGFEATNDYFRWKGSYADVMDAARHLKGMRCFFGATATLRPGNFDELVSQDFLSHLSERGFSYVFYSISSTQLTPKLKAIAKGDFGQKTPVFLYANDGDYGHFSASSRSRIIYVTKRGQLLNDRQERILVGGVDNLHQAETAPQWAKKYRADGMAKKAQEAAEMAEKTAYRLEEAEAAPYLF
ncbi:MAG: radical SAM protein [Candidatus Marsarchaeota archaeon]|nr:radical SAM protein [Candidatus Marsarchaeota archaeon]